MTRSSRFRERGDGGYYPKESRAEPLVAFMQKHGLAAAAIVMSCLGGAYLVMNDMTGSYQGSSPLTGPVQLRIEREGGDVTGSMTLMGDTKLEIIDGRILDNGSIELSLAPPKSQNAVLQGRIGSWSTPSFVGKVEPPRISGYSLELNTLAGTFSNGDKEVPLRLYRNMFASVFHTFWWERK